MATAEKDWMRVTKCNPCPVCGGDSWCRVGRIVVHCMRSESDRPVNETGGGWYHKRDDAPINPPPLPPRKPRQTDAAMNMIWGPKARQWFCGAEQRNEMLAKELGVAAWALSELKVGFDGSAWTFPERNHEGLIVGINRRLVKPMEDGRNKICATGSRRGLTYSDTWDVAAGPILIVEGGSDVAAGLTMGLCVIGRPSNIGGIEYLARLLRHHYRRTIVIGERDRKRKAGHETCKGCPQCWPGRSGAKDTAEKLAKRLSRRVTWTLLPWSAKDLRSYWLKHAAAIEDGFAIGKELLGRLR